MYIFSLDFSEITKIELILQKMEKWQKNHIESHLPELLDNTDCNDSLLSFLKSRNILSSEDIQRIKTTSVQHERATRLYEVLETRTDAFIVLSQALVKTKQSGAYLILNSKNFAKVNLIGNLKVTREKRLGRISITEDLEFFEGRFGTRDIAIRREDYPKILIEDTSSIEKEISFLTQLDCHKNVLRFFTSKIDDDLTHILLVFELCSCTLDEYLRDENKQLTECLKKSILKQLTSGLEFLHNRNTIYLNLRPTSILISEDLPCKVRPKFSNFSSAVEVSVKGKISINSERLSKNTHWLPGNILFGISEDQKHIDVVRFIFLN